jgi:hypothetical protein
MKNLKKASCPPGFVPEISNVPRYIDEKRD